MSKAGRTLRRMLVVVLALTLLAGQQIQFDGKPAAQAQPGDALTITPALGAPGALVTLSAPAGSLPAGAIAIVNFHDATGAYVGILIAHGRVGSDGSLNFPVNILSQAAAGPGRVFVTANGVTISSQFTITPAISVSPLGTPTGSVVQVIGSGFSANATLAFAINGQDAAVMGNDLVVTNTFGSFLAYVIVPRQPPGLTTVSANDGNLSVTVPFLIAADFGSPTAQPAVTIPINGAVTVLPSSTPTPGGPPVSAPASTATTAFVPPTAATATTSGSAQIAYFAEGYTGQAATNGRASFNESLNILNPAAAPAGVTITYFSQGASPISITRTVAPASVLRESVNADVGPDKLVAAAVSASSRVYVTRTITRASAGGTRLDGSTALPVAAPATLWGFPEGYTGYTFQEYLTLLNPGATAAAVTITLAPQASSAVGARMLHLSVPPMSRITANIRALNQGNSAKSVGMLVSSDQPIVAERVIYFGDGSGSGKFGSTVSSGIAAPATLLHLTALTAGAAQNGDQAFITLLNPNINGTPVNVTTAFTDAAGHTLGGPVTVSVAGGTRQTIAVNAALGTAPSGPLSATLNATGPIEAEAAQYYGGSPNIGAHPGIAFPAVGAVTADVFMSDLATTLADGTPINRTVYLYNPGSSAIQVNAGYFGSAGTPVQTSYDVQAGGITTVQVNADAHALPPGPLGAEFRLASGGSGGFIAFTVGLSADRLFAAGQVGEP